MKILIYAAKEKTGLLTSFLDKLGQKAEVVALEKIEQTRAMTPTSCDDIEIGFVDASLNNSDKFYQHIRQTSVMPVVILIENDEANWLKLSDMGLSGYLDLSGDPDIVKSSLKAIIRCLPGYKETALAA